MYGFYAASSPRNPLLEQYEALAQQASLVPTFGDPRLQAEQVFVVDHLNYARDVQRRATPSVWASLFNRPIRDVLGPKFMTDASSSLASLQAASLQHAQVLAMTAERNSAAALGRGFLRSPSYIGAQQIQSPLFP
jgi:hypothetical protein